MRPPTRRWRSPHNSRFFRGLSSKLAPRGNSDSRQNVADTLFDMLLTQTAIKEGAIPAGLMDQHHACAAGKGMQSGLVEQDK